MSIHDRAAELLRLHEAPEILTLFNVWDVVTATVIADLPGTTALATASHSIAASLGYEDGEHIPIDSMIETVGRIVAATDLPVSADLEAGYGDASATVRKAIGIGVVGANIEDEMRPLGESVSVVESVVAAAEAEGVAFCLNARTDAFLRAGDRPLADVTSDAIERGRAYLGAGASTVFVPGLLEESTVRMLVEAYGRQRLTMIGVPGTLPLAVLQDLGVARVSYGPWAQRVALTAMARAASDILDGGALPDGTRAF